MSLKKIIKQWVEIPNTPTSLPSRLFPNKPNEYTWEDFYEGAKILYPTRYFLSKTLPRWWWKNFGIPIELILYRIKSYFKKYHLLDLRQPHTGTTDDYTYGWIDECNKIVYANFNILVNYYEDLIRFGFRYNATPSGRAELKEYINQVENEDEKSALQEQLNHLEEVYTLYSYWTASRKIKLNRMEVLLRDWSEYRLKDIEDSNRRRGVLDKYESEFFKEEEEMLIRLIKIHRSLWI